MVLFDGQCALCDASVRFIKSKDPKTVFSFAPIQSESGRKLLKDRGLNPSTLNSLVLIDKDSVFTESAAVLRIASKLAFPWKLFGVFGVVPRMIRDPLYRWVAKHRYDWRDRLK